MPTRNPRTRAHVATPMRTRSAVPLAVLLLAACAERDLVTSSDDAMDDDEPEPGDQPLAPGAMYAPCQASSECPSLLCVFPEDEAGFCSAPCTAPTDPGSCDPPPGDQTASCLDIGLPDGSWACALDCSEAPCPRGMRCEQVAASDGERAICF